MEHRLTVPVEESPENQEGECDAGHGSARPAPSSTAVKALENAWQKAVGYNWLNAEMRQKVLEAERAGENLRGHFSPRLTYTVAEPVAMENIHYMIFPHRQALLFGDKWTVKIGRKKIFTIPKNLIMTVSTVAQGLQIAHPDNNVLTIQLPKGIIPEGHVTRLLNWLLQTTEFGQAGRTMTSHDSFEETIGLIQAARLLGMHQYVATLGLDISNYLATAIPTYEEIDTITSLVFNSDDILYYHLVKRLAKLRPSQIPDPEEWQEYLLKRPNLVMAMSRFHARRDDSVTPREWRLKNNATRKGKKAQKQAEARAAIAE